MLREAQLGIQLPEKAYRSQKRFKVAKKLTEIGKNKKQNGFKAA
jgi:hypothetical protein